MFSSASITRGITHSCIFFFWLLLPRGCFFFLLQREEGAELGRWVPSLSGALGPWARPLVADSSQRWWPETQEAENHIPGSLPGHTHISIYYCKRHVDDADENVTQASFLHPPEVGVGGQWNKQSSSLPPASEKLRASTQPPETFRQQLLVFVFFTFLAFQNANHEGFIKNATRSITVSPVVSWWFHFSQMLLSSSPCLSSHFMKQYFP